MFFVKSQKMTKTRNSEFFSFYSLIGGRQCAEKPSVNPTFFLKHDVFEMRKTERFDSVSVWAWPLNLIRSNFFKNFLLIFLVIFFTNSTTVGKSTRGYFVLPFYFRDDKTEGIENMVV